MSRPSASGRLAVIGVAILLAAVAVALVSGARTVKSRRQALAFAVRITKLPLGDATHVRAVDDAELSTQLYGRLERSVAAGMSVGLPPLEAPEPWPKGTNHEPGP